MKSLIASIEKEAKNYFNEKSGHDFSHVERVLKVAKQIAKTENGCDMEVLVISVLLHDIGRKDEDEGKCECHAEEGARLAPLILKKYNIPKDKITQISEAIRIHRKSKGIRAETIEAKILQDADRLDVFGAVGISRTFVEHAKKMILHSNSSRKLTSLEDYNTDSIFEYVRSLLLVKKDYLYTKKARQILKERLKFIEEYIKQFEKEWA
jgi:uncharacterized protein